MVANFLLRQGDITYPGSDGTGQRSAHGQRSAQGPACLQVTVVGELSRRKHSGSMDMEIGRPIGGGPFYVTRKTVHELCEGLEMSRAVFKWMAIVSGAMGAGIVVRNLWVWWRSKVRSHVLGAVAWHRGERCLFHSTPSSKPSWRGSPNLAALEQEPGRGQSLFRWPFAALTHTGGF